MPPRPSLAIRITLTLLAVAVLGWLWFTRYALLHFDINAPGSATDGSANDITITDARTRRSSPRR